MLKFISLNRWPAQVSMHEAGLLKLVYWDNPEGWDEEGGGRGFRTVGGGHVYTRGWFMSMYDKTHHYVVLYVLFLIVVRSLFI